MDKINPIYRKLIENIKVDSEDDADEGMKPVYVEQKKALDTLHASVGMLFIKYAVDGFLKMNTTQKANSVVNETLKTMGKTLGSSEVKKVSDILGKTYSNTYYKNAFVQDSGLKIDLKFDLLKKEFVDVAVNAKYKDEMFSDRIWKNKSDMIDKLQSSITDAMKGQTTIDKIGKAIKDTFNVQAYESQRLVNTETARVQTQATDDIGTNTGVTKQLFSATLDDKTNPEDASYDGQIFAIDDPDKPIPPLHPNCRCVLINMPESDWKPTQRMDNETKDIIDYADYDTWSKEKGID